MIATDKKVDGRRPKLLPGIAVAGGTLVLIGLGLIPAALVLAPSLFWYEVEAERASVAIVPVHGSWMSLTKYDYQVEGQRYSGERYSFVPPEDYMTEDELRLIQGGPDRYRTCFANRFDASRSVLRAQIPLRALMKNTVFSALAVAVMLWGYKRLRREPR